MANKRLKRLNKHMAEVNRLREQSMQEHRLAGHNTNRKTLRAQIDAAARLGSQLKTPEQMTMEDLDRMFR